jgi:hypothetical protein
MARRSWSDGPTVPLGVLKSRLHVLFRMAAPHVDNLQHLGARRWGEPMLDWGWAWNGRSPNAEVGGVSAREVEAPEGRDLKSPGLQPGVSGQ